MEEKNIWTVVILGRESEELSTVSFNDFDAAVDYVISELEEAGEDVSDFTRRYLEDQHFLRREFATYWIEDTKLF